MDFHKLHPCLWLYTNLEKNYFSIPKIALLFHYRHLVLIEQREKAHSQLDIQSITFKKSCAPREMHKFGTPLNLGCLIYAECLKKQSMSLR